MTDPTTLPTHKTPSSAASPPMDGATGTTGDDDLLRIADDGGLLRIAIWLAEVSAEAAREATPTALAPRHAGEAEQPVPEALG